MPGEPSDNSMRVLLLAPTSRDGEAGRVVLSAAGVECWVCRNLDELCDEVERGVAVAVIPEEIIQSDGSERLTRCVRDQPVWSDIPFVILARAGVESSAVEKAVRSLGNASLIERPMRVSTLISVVRSALRARERQYQVKGHLAERLRVEEERLRLLEAERTARMQAERASSLKDEFLATLSHELRTPLNAIMGWSQILSAGNGEPGDIKEGLETIQRNARAQAQIIEDLLDMSRIISGKFRFDVVRVELGKILKEAVETVRPAADAKGVRIQMVLDGFAGPVSGDPNRLQQIFWNLLTNAVKFTPRGGRVQVLCERVNSHIQISVADTGQGISAEFLPHVFDRFRQAEATTTRTHGGLGLGLAIVKQLVEMHGGSIGARSPGEGKGSTFTVSLPVTAIHQEVEVEARRHPTARTGRVELDACASIAGVHVLVVDDEPDARALIKRLLEDCDAVVRVASSAAEAVELTVRSAPDVLVSDIGMPGEDGYSLIRRIRELPPQSGGTVPAIALTAYARPQDRMVAVMAGFQHHLAKPVEPAELITMVASLVRVRSLK